MSTASAIKKNTVVTPPFPSFRGIPFASLSNEIAAISPVFSYGPSCEAFSVTEGCRERLEQTCARIVKEGRLIALYVPESTADEVTQNGDRYDPATYGRIVALVRPVPMPSGKTVDDFPRDAPRSQRAKARS